MAYRMWKELWRNSIAFTSKHETAIAGEICALNAVFFCVGMCRKVF